MTGVEAGENRLQRIDADSGRQHAVQGALKVFGWNGNAERKGSHLREGVHPGIRPPGALGQNLFPGNAPERVCENALDSGQAGLHLPAMEVRAVITKSHLPVREAHLSKLSS